VNEPAAGDCAGLVRRARRARFCGGRVRMLSPAPILRYHLIAPPSGSLATNWRR
jgi:hypothetical protein